jgi:hypothetical protein
VFVEHGADEMADAAEASHDNAGLIILRRRLQCFRRISLKFF